MKYPGLVICMLCIGFFSSAQQASTATAQTSVNIIYPVGIMIETVYQKELPPLRNSGQQAVHYNIPVKTLPAVFVDAAEVYFNITVKEDERVNADLKLYRVTVHIN